MREFECSSYRESTVTIAIFPALSGPAPVFFESWMVH